MTRLSSALVLVLASLALADLPAARAQVTVLEDEFDGTELHPDWQISTVNVASSDLGVSDGRLIVTDIVPYVYRSAIGAGYDYGDVGPTAIRLERAFAPTTDLELSFSMSWRTMHIYDRMYLSVALLDDQDNYLAFAQFVDGWGNPSDVSAAGYWVQWVGGEYIYNSTRSTEFYDEDVTFRMTRLGTQYDTHWNSSSNPSGGADHGTISDAPAAKVVIGFIFLDYNGNLGYGPSMFGTEWVDFVRVTDLATPADTDNDGLTDADELSVHHTDPNDADTDDDGLLDGTEVDMAEGSGCPNPLVADSDGDGLNDGYEVGIGSSPCMPDTDDDGVRDDRDPTPTDPGVPSSFIEAELRDLGAEIDALGLSVFSGKTDNAAAGRRNALSNKANAAANAVAAGNIVEAVEELYSVLDKVDGEPEPPDWMLASPEKDAVAMNVALLIELLLLL